MPTTTNVLAGGVTINEVQEAGVGLSQDYNGDGTADFDDQFIELVNLSGSPVDISGWEIYTGVSGLVHTFAPGTILGAGEHITVVDSGDGTGNPISNIVGTAVYSDSPMLIGDAVSYFVYDSTNGEYIEFQGFGNASFHSFDENLVLAAHPGATSVGPQEALPSNVAGQSIQRVTDGDTSFVVTGPNPGQANCFLPGTLIATSRGEVRVEDLKPGDLVLSADGDAMPVRFLFRQTVATRFGPAERLQPVRLAAGSLGDGIPHADLMVTADHAILLEGTLCAAGALVNGTTITRVPLAEMGKSYTTWHIECDAHAVVLANGVAAETYVDHTPRHLFDNHGDYLALYGADRPLTELSLPRATTTRQLPASLRATFAPRRSA